MLSLFFNRSMLLSGRLIGILVIMGLVSCSGTPKTPGPPAPPQKDAQKLQQTSELSHTEPSGTKSAQNYDLTSIQLEGEFQFHLPNDFITLFSDHNNTPKLLKELLQFPDCNDFNYNGQKKFFTATCSYFMNQSQRSSFKPKTNGNYSISSFTLNEEDLSPKISAAVETQHYTLCCDANCKQIKRRQQLVSFPYQCLKNDLYAYVSPLSHCKYNEISKTKRPLKDVILSGNNEFKPTFPSCEVKLFLPAALLKNAQVSSSECKSEPQNNTLLHCRLSSSDINLAAKAEAEAKKKSKPKFQKTFTLNLGNGWESANVSVDIIKEQHHVIQQLMASSRPRWPFAPKDSWWQWKESSGKKVTNSCMTSPKYEIDSVTYKNDANHQTLTKSKLLELNLQKKLPTLENIRWDENWPLPDTVSLNLRQQGIKATTANTKYSDQPKYRYQADIDWKLSEVPTSPQWRSSIKYKKELENIVTMNVSTRSLDLDSNTDYAVYQFKDKKSCRNLKGGIQSAELQSGTTQIDIKPCFGHIKVLDNLTAKPVSRCTQPVNQILRFKPYKCSGKRKLIVVALGEKLNRYHQPIKDAIANIFQANLKDRKPLTLVTIKTGRILSKPLLQCEDLNDMNPSEAKPIIYQKNKMPFGAYDLRTLEDLELVNYDYQNKLDQLDSIFYLTDGASMPNDKTKIRQLAVIPKDSWNADHGIKLKVLTIGDCKVWIKNAKANCLVLKDAGTIEKALQQFIRGN